MTLRKLRQQKIEAIEAVKKLNALETLSPEQNQELEKRWGEAKSLENRISIMEDTEKQSLEAEPEKRKATIPKKQPKYSFLNAVKLIKDRSLGGYELECHQEMEKRGHKAGFESVMGESILVPVEHMFAPTQKTEKRIVATTDALIDDAIREDLRVKALYERSIASRLGIKMVSGTGKYRIPVGSTVSANWFSGTGGNTADDKISGSDETFTSISVVPHYLGSISGWSFQLLKESAGSVNLEMLLRESLVATLANELDNSIINADNTGPKPQGFNTWLGSTNMKTKTVSTSSKWAYSDFTDRIKVLRDNFKNLQMDPMWLMGTTDEKLLREVQRFASSDGESILDSIGKYLVSGRVPATRLWLGDWSNFQVTVFDAAEISLGRMNNDLETQTTRLVGVLCADFTGLRKEAFTGFTITRG